MMDGWSEDDKERWQFDGSVGQGRVRMQWRDGFTSQRCLTTSDGTKLNVSCSVRADHERPGSSSGFHPKPIFSCSINPMSEQGEEGLEEPDHSGPLFNFEVSFFLVSQHFFFSFVNWLNNCNAVLAWRKRGPE